jgi:murein DD-endopeptidase MepM/ murein hydrolase activator NlpD
MKKHITRSLLIPTLFITFILVMFFLQTNTVEDAYQASLTSTSDEEQGWQLTEGTTSDTPELQLAREIRGEILSGESLTVSLSRSQVPVASSSLIISHLGEHLDFKRLQVGNQYTIVLDEDETLLSCSFQLGPLDTYSLTRSPDGYSVARLDVPLEVQTVTMVGEVQTSLFTAFAELGEEAKLVYSFADIFASKIDFNTETRVGDRFIITVQKYLNEGNLVGYGTILYAAYLSADNDKINEGFYFSSDKKPGGYFDRNGKELGNSFLRSPVPMGRVTSGFTNNRLHPILGYSRPHKGIDFAAPMGTPILAVGDGRVVFQGRNGGFGKQVVLDHGNGDQTHYAHLSRFKNGLHVGSQVKKKQVIGYVGSTGLSTGPHVDFRFAQNGVFVNPLTMKFNPRSELAGVELSRFQGLVADLAVSWEAATEPRIIKVKHVIFSPENPPIFL